MEKEFVSYEMALDLKELGFNEPCFTYYYNVSCKLRTNISVETNNGWTYFPNKKSITLAPTFSQAFRFFREKHNLHSNIKCVNTTHNNHFRFEIELNGETLACTNRIDSYEKAELACLQKLIEITKN
ncbi:hypothetical protein UFOVP458_53 [uncultured Caudovirales phage]|uniref:Uncharacterized protein n=1 Tax=uncultured Caudovirales phage TaxID=2100421 RepID=A0A6J5MC51_9CAUD|nr:hypothetical protein UFOVP458_53 [uncultured Caudovirales phage]